MAGMKKSITKAAPRITARGIAATAAMAVKAAPVIIPMATACITGYRLYRLGKKIFK